MADSQKVAKELDDAGQRAEQLRRRLTELDVEIEAKQSDLGKAMAHGDPDTNLKGIKKALRDVEDEKEGAERGLVFLADETERLEGELASAKTTEAEADRDAKVAEAVAAIDALAEALCEWAYEAFLPLADAAESRSAEAFEAERQAVGLAVDQANGSRVQKGWARYQGLAFAVRALRAYAGRPASLRLEAPSTPVTVDPSALTELTTPDRSNGD